MPARSRNPWFISDVVQLSEQATLVACNIWLLWRTQRSSLLQSTLSSNVLPYRSAEDSRSGRRTLTLWRRALGGELEPGASFVAALDRADTRDRTGNCFVEATRQSAIQGSTSMRTNWSNRFADACRTLLPIICERPVGWPAVTSLHGVNGSSEPKRVFGSTEKKLDVVVTSPLVGLEASISLKE